MKHFFHMAYGTIGLVLGVVACLLWQHFTTNTNTHTAVAPALVAKAPATSDAKPTKSLTPGQKAYANGWSTEASSFDYQSAVNQFGVYAVVGTDTWHEQHENGAKKTGTNPKVYICRPKTDQKPATLKEFAIPKLNGSNKFFDHLDSPQFSKNGRYLIALLHYKCGKHERVCIASWDMSCGYTEVIHTMDPEICACDWPGDHPPKPGTLARWYLDNFKQPHKVTVDEHSVTIGNEEWERIP